MPEVRTEDERQAKLLSLWQQLANALDAAWPERAEKLRTAVLAPWQAAAASPSQAWTRQAQALLAWTDICAQIPGNESETTWAQLKRECTGLRQRVAREIDTGPGGLAGLFGRGKEQQRLLQDVLAFLRTCESRLEELERCKAAESTGDTPAELHRQVDAELADLSPSWPPKPLVEIVVRLRPCDPARPTDLIRHLQEKIDARRGSWRQELEAAWPAFDGDLPERVILVRALLEVLSEAAATDDGWAAFGDFAREVFAGRDVQCEVVCDLQQPGEWFERVEADVEAARVERPGLALRRGSEPWVCFPLARVVWPGPDPPGYAELRAVLEPVVSAETDAIWERVRGWRAAARAGTLELAAVQTYVDFFGELGEPLWRQDSEKAQRVGEVIKRVLQSEFKLYAFSPVQYQEHPDGWLQRVGGNAMVTGRVKRVLRPGLQDEHNHLRVPALVEVE